MSSNYNYNFTLAHLNSLNPVATPEKTAEELARELEYWTNNVFIEVPPGMSLLDDDFPKLEEQNVTTQPTMIVGQDLSTLADQAQAQQTLHHYPLFSLNSLVPTSLLTTPSSDNFTSVFSAPVTNVVNNILSKETKENPSNTTSTTKVTKATKITTDPTSTAPAKTTTATNTTTSSTTVSSRKNSTKSNQSSNSETSQNFETKDDEKDPELAAKLAAEEDKRRRNTAASARFRVKKKMREQALERTAREMTAKAEVFENKVKELEMEIKWLRSLVVEKDARLLDIERPGKRRKRVESNDDDDDNDEKGKLVKQESNQANPKEQLSP